MQKRNAD